MEIKALRKALGLTQAQLAKRLGIASYTVSRWERGEHRPTQAMRVALDRLEKRANNGNKGS